MSSERPLSRLYFPSCCSKVENQSRRRLLTCEQQVHGKTVHLKKHNPITAEQTAPSDESRDIDVKHLEHSSLVHRVPS